MNNLEYKEIFKLLEKLAASDENCLFAFVHGSTVEGHYHEKSICETRLFNGSKYVGSVFKSRKIQSDIDVVWVTQNMNSTKAYIDSYKNKFNNKIYTTINIMTKNILLREINSKDPMAVKHVFLGKRIFYIKGASIGKRIQSENKDNLSKLDYEWMEEFQYRRRYTREELEKHTKEEIFISESYQKERFPLFVEFLNGNINHAFPADRYKFVVPHSMGMKRKFDVTQKKFVLLT